MDKRKENCNMNKKGFIKWIPVIVTTTVALIQAIAEVKDADRIDDMDERIQKLESENEKS